MRESEAGYRMRNKVLSTVIKVMALVLVLFAVYTLVSLQGEITRKELQSNELEHDIAATKQDIQRIQENIDAVSTDEGVRKIARDKLGLVGAGEYVFQDVGN